MRRIYDWKTIQEYHDEGHGFVECRLKFGLTHTAWNKAIRRGELQTSVGKFTDRRRRYDWAAIQAYHDQGHNLRETMARFGFYAKAWYMARERGEINAHWVRRPLHLILASKSRVSIKRRLLEEGILENRCSECGLTTWRGKKLVIQLDHINGVHDDYRLKNLRMLCPNCHSQTPTHGGKNVRRKRLQESGSAL